MYNNFPFTIRQVAEVLNLQIRYGGQNNGNVDVDCPFCQKKSKMNLNAAKNVYRCNYCGEYGGMIQLYGKAHGISNSDAYREICELLGCDRQNPVSYKAAAEKPAVEMPNRANDAVVHQTYSMLLSLLVLATPHKEQLLERGLSTNDIVKFNYKSVPAFGQKGLCAKLLDSGCTLEGVPGFYKETDGDGVWNGLWNVKLKAAGVLIPVCGIDGKIAAMQIRLNNPINSRRYIWLSSSDKVGGTSSGAPIHFVGDPTDKRVYVTEGPLKGTVAHNLTRQTFICLPGAKNIGRLDSVLEHLKANGTQEVVEALDMDKYTNIHISDAAEKLRNKLSAHGFKVMSDFWEDKSYNGVDDYYLHRLQQKRKLIYDVDINAASVPAAS